MRAPIIALVVAFTAVPMEWRWASAGTLRDALSLNVDFPDIIANFLGFVPVGIVLANVGRWRAAGMAALLSALVEAVQLFCSGRSTSLIDVATNTAGGVFGATIAAQWGVHRMTVGRRHAVVAATLALLICVMLAMQMTPEDFDDAVAVAVASPPWRPVNERGAATAGKLEGFWNFDTVREVTVSDESGSGLTGALIQRPQLVDGVAGKAVALNGENQWVDLGTPLALQLVGSLTITAWINATAFPTDDAAIVSAHTGLGYQLDTTVDEGARTIGFKLANSHGKLMARYGRTPLQLNRWYHLAGVYDANAATMNVYLNGRLDNGCLRGHVTGSQHASGESVLIGSRPRARGYEFAGAIDEVRIFSRALTPEELVDQVAHVTSALVAPDASSGGGPNVIGYKGDPSDSCVSKDPSDARVAGLLVAVGMLTAVAAVGLLGCTRLVGAVAASLAAGLFVLPLVTPLVPPYFVWLVPLLTSAGGLVVAASIGQRTIVETEGSSEAECP